MVCCKTLYLDILLGGPDSRKKLMVTYEQNYNSSKSLESNPFQSLLSPFSSVLSKPIPVDSHPYHSTESVFVQVTRSSLLQNLAVIGLDCGQHLIQLVTPSFSKYCSLLDSRTPFSLVPHPWLLLFISQAPPHCKAQSLDPSLHHLHYLLR